MTYQAYVFDVYGTLFDVYSISEKCTNYFSDKGARISQSWRQKQLEYCFLRQIIGSYIPFHEITKEALQYVCISEQVYTTEEIITDLLQAYLKLSPFAEVKQALEMLQSETLVVFSNGSLDMLHPLLNHSGLTSYFQHIISVDEIKQYKPSPSAYQHVCNRLNMQPKEILFLSSNTWDVAGASRFGFQTAWINRSNATMDLLDVTPNYIVNDLQELIGQLT
ncbi:2-haloacid dehalogenase [Anoxybacillus voinovskiensis]|uniref:2-haloacid dehalogenase n=1 Tax=Anoxybacteroides voinovskiense TaxID=230470 RepID=A0A840DHP9_9BACL|nr:haloacid dehalogenase type II [Anoxybacillus voinovskiensis]MBB4072260.1 2-haloacid dehalogenase [Anoxybacillus voinovskiensis]GGJ59303.1 haloacid dehalogenase [Anoxybacillus voinovskiensis]